MDTERGKERKHPLREEIETKLLSDKRIASVIQDTWSRCCHSGNRTMNNSVRK